MRVQVTALPQIGDGRAHATRARLETVGYPVGSCHVADVYLLSGVPGLTAQHARELFCDPVAQRVRVDGDLAPDDAHAEDASPCWDLLVEVGSRPGVADPIASSIRDALTAELGRLPADAVVQTARQYFIALDGARVGAASSRRAAGELHNPLIEHAVVITRDEWDSGERPPELYPTVAGLAPPPVERIDVAAMDDAELERLSGDRLLALTLPELRAIRDYYADPRPAPLARAPDSARRRPTSSSSSSRRRGASTASTRSSPRAWSTARATARSRRSTHSSGRTSRRPPSASPTPPS